MKISKRLNNKQLTKVIKKQIGLCLRHRCFHSVFFVSYLRKKDIVFEYLQYFCNKSRFIKNNIFLIRNSSNGVTVCFKNGSSIRVASGTSHAKGCRATNVVIDSDIADQEFIHCVVREIIVPIMIVPPKWITQLFGIKPRYRKRLGRTEYVVDI